MRPTYLEVNLTQLKKNIEAIRAHVAPAKIMPMVKANAYGHGVDGVAPFIAPFADYIGVALVEEGIYLRYLYDSFILDCDGRAEIKGQR